MLNPSDGRSSWESPLSVRKSTGDSDLGESARELREAVSESTASGSENSAPEKTIVWLHPLRPWAPVAHDSSSALV